MFLYQKLLLLSLILFTRLNCFFFFTPILQEITEILSEIERTRLEVFETKGKNDWQKVKQIDINWFLKSDYIKSKKSQKDPNASQLP